MSDGQWQRSALGSRKPASSAPLVLGGVWYISFRTTNKRLPVTVPAIPPAVAKLSSSAPWVPGSGTWFPSTSHAPPDPIPTGYVAVDIRYINGRQNKLQGTRLNQFYALSAQDCGLEVGDPFLALPSRFGSRAQTTWSCNVPASP